MSQFQGEGDHACMELRMNQGSRNGGGEASGTHSFSIGFRVFFKSC